MADTTGIEWTDKTYNPWIGCTKVSPGCTHCYAETFSLQKKYISKWGNAGERKITKTALDPENWNQEALENKTRYTVFCASLSDVFEDHPALPAARADLWRLIVRTPFLDWMILTKRAENIARMLPPDWGEGYANVCLMVSVENQEYFDQRVPLLREVPAKYRALSVEPLVGHVRMPKGSLAGIDLVIVGGESDKNARPMNPNWVRHIRDACARDKVDFFFKQWGNWTPDKAHAEDDLLNGAVFESYEAEATPFTKFNDLADRKAAIKSPGNQVVYFSKSKKTTGSKIDGKEHKEHPFLAGRIKNPVTPIIGRLTAADKSELSSLEVIVSAGLKSFWEAGRALRQIRDRGLYRDSHETFEDYCSAKWEISRAEAYRQIGAASVIDDISTGNPERLPTSISQTRPLLKLKTATERRSAWGKASADPKTIITAEVVEEAVQSLRKTTSTKRLTKQKPARDKKEQAPAYPVRAQFKDLADELTLAASSADLKKISSLLRKLKRLLPSIES